MAFRKINIRREQASDPQANWLIDKVSSDEVSEFTGLGEKGEDLLENHISPDGRYILICKNGLEIFEFMNEYLGNDKFKTGLLKRDWQIPITTKEMEIE